MGMIHAAGVDLRKQRMSGIGSVEPMSQTVLGIRWDAAIDELAFPVPEKKLEVSDHDNQRVWTRRS